VPLFNHQHTLVKIIRDGFTCRDEFTCRNCGRAMVLLTVIFTIDPFTSRFAARRVVASFVAFASGSVPCAEHRVDKLRLVRAPDDNLKHEQCMCSEFLQFQALAYCLLSTSLVICILYVGFWLGRVSGGLLRLFMTLDYFREPWNASCSGLCGASRTCLHLQLRLFATKFWRTSLAKWLETHGRYVSQGGSVYHAGGFGPKHCA